MQWTHQNEKRRLFHARASNVNFRTNRVACLPAVIPWERVVETSIGEVTWLTPVDEWETLEDLLAASRLEEEPDVISMVIITFYVEDAGLH